MPQDESVVGRAGEYFLRHRRYIEEDLASDYQAELRNYRDDAWEAPQRAARLSAAIKRYRTYEMLYFSFQITDEAEPDYTPLIVKRLYTHLFGRQGSRNITADILGQKGCMHRSHDNDPDTVAVVIERYRQQTDDR